MREKVDRRSHILVIDDEEQNTTLLEKVLAHERFENVQVLNASIGALSMFRSFEPDLVLLDLHMPEPDGFDLLEQFTGELADDDFVPILVLTADASDYTRLKALRCGATDFLSKPFQINEVTARIENLLHTRLLHSELRRHKAQLENEVEDLRADEREREQHLKEVGARTQAVIDGEGLVMVYQPVVDMKSGNIVGAEALARFTADPGRSPDLWFREAAEVGMAQAIELTAIRLALDGSAGHLPAHAFLSINASAATLRSPALIAALREHPERRVVVELTEHEAIEDYRGVLEAMGRLRAQGARIAIDDTGSGYASMHHLLEMRPDIVKLDRFLISGVDRDPVKQALVTALVRFGGDVGVDLIAEGIETEVELEVLRDLGFAWGQGYFLARPAHLPFEPDLLDRLATVVV